MMLRFNYFITKEIVNIPENAGKQEENKKLANPTLSEKITIIFCCVPFFACMDVGVDILMKTRCGCCC